MTEPGFHEGGVAVSQGFVRAGTLSINVAEISKVDVITYRTDAASAPIAWIFIFISFVIWVVAPVQNIAVLPVLIGFGAFAFYKQTNPKPTRHRLMLGTGSLLNTSILDTDDAEFVQRVRQAIESAVGGK